MTQRGAAILLILGFMVASTLGASSALANNIGGAAWAPSWIGGYGKFQTSWRTPNDSFAIYLNAKWDATHRAAVVSHYANGWRYTQDFRDGTGVLPLSLNATGRYAATLENPVYDRDDDNGDGRNEEAEITANSTSFPSVNTNYYAQTEYSHWYRTCGNCNWTWDPDSAEVGMESQISKFFLGEWQTEKHTGQYRYVSTPYQPPPSGFAGVSDSTSATGFRVLEGDAQRGWWEMDGLEAWVLQDARDADVHVTPPSSLGAYIAANASRLLALPRVSTELRVVITFRQPLTEDEVINALGDAATITSLEAVGNLKDGRILTVGGPGPVEWHTAQFERHEVAMRGIVAVEAVVATYADVVSLAQESGILLVDVAIETLTRGAPRWVHDLRRGGQIDVVLNDVYWLHAGWDS
jgi:hypothetical protein